ncbi:hypothetical protein BCIN_04g06360 [Botrytis cinerea B05.10]|uniref:Uncharacterized protein n=1 Tax=Botryotinia fuckeliana (strain B05.10) TaxID=332648 RepID=A0A384JFX1_BOTFB|nr:hypothetical protein BCIN_04g06360 [Botrytis cinerea B05.10]ATZ49496.1 hypothetical protein BCIN_04g06360 [Botrytis cinerea B05.10]
MMMEFFDHMRVLADKLHDRTRISLPHSHDSNSDNNLEGELDELIKYLSTIHARFLDVQGTSGQNGDPRSSGELIRILISVHANLQATLQSIEEEDEKSYTAKKAFLWNSERLNSVAEAIAIENHKLRVLLCTFDPDENVETAIPLEWRRWRLRKMEGYVETEIQRCGRQRCEVSRLDGYNYQFKWNKLNDAEYLSHISGDKLCKVSAKSWEFFIQCFTRNLQIAQEESCGPSDRWIHLMICSHYLMSARDSREYRQFVTYFKHPQDLCIIDTGFTLHHYITELEILLFGILTELETEYLNPDDVQERTKKRNSQQSTPLIPQTPIVQERHESVSTGSTQSMGIDEYGVIFKCQLGGEQVDHVMKIRMDAEGALTLDFDEELRLWPNTLQAFRELDLRRASIYPNYLTPGIYMCDLTLERKLRGRSIITSGCLFFQSSTNLKEFQRALTGYKVLVDFQRGIKVRTLEKYQFKSKNAITGRLQIWLKDFSRGNDSTQVGASSSLRRASTSLSAMSRTTFASIATLKAQQAIPGSHLTTIDEGSGLQIEMPVPPLVIMFVESSSRDGKIQRGQILAFKFAEHSKLDRKKCKPDDKFPRCFVLHPVRCDLEIGPLKFPQNSKELSWLEVSFSKDEEREIFTRQLEDARKIYHRRTEQHNQGLKFMQQGRHNTKEYGVD